MAASEAAPAGRHKGNATVGQRTGIEVVIRSIGELAKTRPVGVYSIDMKTAKHIGIKKNFKGENKLVVPLKYWNRKSQDNINKLF